MAPIDVLTIVFIRASNYDDDGFLVRYLRGVLPSNTLSCMRSLTLDFADTWRGERGIDSKVEVYDEIVDTVPFKRPARMNRGTRKVIVAVVGVQSNQYPRAGPAAGPELHEDLSSSMSKRIERLHTFGSSPGIA